MSQTVPVLISLSVGHVEPIKNTLIVYTICQFCICSKSDCGFGCALDILWNNLPVTIKNKPSLSLFKKALKNQPRVINTISFDGIVGTNKDIDVFIY